MAITRAQANRELVPGLHALWGLENKRYQDEWKPIFETNSSERAFEEEVALSGFGTAAIKTEGSSVTYDTAQEFYATTYRHITVALAFAITEEAIEDNLYAELGARYTKALAWSMNNTKEVTAASVLNNGFSASYLGGDGKRLFATDHPLVSGGVNSNRPATYVDLSETALENAVIQIGAWTDQRGLLIAVKPKQLIIPNALSFAADKILNTVLKTDSADNTINSIYHTGAIPKGYHVNHYLTDPDAFFLTTDAPDGLKHFNRVARSFSKDGDFDTGNLRWKARERYSFFWTNPLGAWGSEGI
jgi:hypothetical protein